MSFTKTLHWLLKSVLSRRVRISRRAVHLSHELRTPLNAVLGLSRLLLDSHLTREQREWALGIQNSGEELLQWVDRVTQNPEKRDLKLIKGQGVSGPQPVLALSKARILVVEDNPMNQKITLKLLEKLGARTALACDGAEALNLLERQHFDLVLMDCQMPRVDGFEATRRIRTLPSSKTNQLPIIALTASTSIADRQRCRDAGMDDYLSKPVRMEDLAGAINKWILKKEQQKTEQKPAA